MLFRTAQIVLKLRQDEAVWGELSQAMCIPQCVESDWYRDKYPAISAEVQSTFGVRDRAVDQPEVVLRSRHRHFSRFSWYAAESVVRISHLSARVRFVSPQSKFAVESGKLRPYVVTPSRSPVPRRH